MAEKILHYAHDWFQRVRIIARCSLHVGERLG